MARGVEHRQGAVAEHVEFAVELEPLVIAGRQQVVDQEDIAPVRGGPVRVTQLALHGQQPGMGEHEQAAGMVHVEMGHHDVLDVGDLVAQRLDLVVDRQVLAEPHHVAEHLAPVRRHVLGDLGMAAGVVQHQSLGMLDQEGRHRNLDDFIAAAGHQT